MINFNRFKEAVIADMKGFWDESFLKGFKDRSPKAGRVLFEFSHPKAQFSYSFDNGEWCFVSNRGSNGRGYSLAEAHEQESRKYNAAF